MFAFEDIISVQSTSAVYKMSSFRDNGPVALKCVAAANAPSLERESIIMQLLEACFPSVPRVLCFEKNVMSPSTLPTSCPQKAVLAETFFKGAPLHKLVAHFTVVDELVVAHVCSQIISLLERIHNANVVYVDLKLPNILLTCSGEVKLVDFGSSVIVNDEARADPQVFRRGTTHVRSPELELGIITNPFLIDFWALGICTIELLSGQPMFDSVNALNNVSFPQCRTPEAIDFALSLVRCEPNLRLGVRGIDEIKLHPFITRATSGTTFPLAEEYIEEIEMQTLGL